jgi:hypothetical protein
LTADGSKNQLKNNIDPRIAGSLAHEASSLSNHSPGFGYGFTKQAVPNDGLSVHILFKPPVNKAD